MALSNVDIIRAGYERFARGEMEAVWELLDPDVEFYQSSELPWGGRYKGHAQVRDFLAKLFGSIESKVSPEQFVEAGDQVVEIGHTRGRARSTGKELDVPEVHIWTFANGRVVRFEAYIDHPKMLAALKP
jgi:uncharacterized protein